MKTGKAIHKWIAAGLLVSLVAPFIGLGLWSSYQQQVTRNEVMSILQAGVSKNLLTLLVFNNKRETEQLTWKHSKEFSFRGEMYDVMEKELKGDYTYYWCWKDHKETKLNKEIKTRWRSLLGFGKDKKTSNDRKLAVFNPLFYQHQAGIAFTMDFREITTYEQPLDYYSYYFPPPVPPPQIG